MKKIIYPVLLSRLLALSSLDLSHAYTFGMLSPDDEVASIQNMEESYDLTLPMVSFIRDDYNDQAV
jgi:hypothetical protein